ncbi:MAG: GntR family transcriptional regulator [Pseudomonadota bacterium]
MSAKTDCYEALRSRILSLDIAPGSDMDEASLSEAYGLSRTPLREVLQRLAGEGFVTLAANRGAKVSSMDLPRMRTFFQTAPLVYAGIARMAAENATVAEINALKATQLAFSKTRDGGELALLNHQFHGQIGQAARNPYLEAALGRMLIDHTRLSQTFYRPTSAPEAERIRAASDQHDEMIAAFEVRDTAAATDVTLRHWDLSRDSLERFVRPDPLPHDLKELRDAV